MARGSNAGGRYAPGRGGSGVSAARLSQKTGRDHAFGGYAKVQIANGTFTMLPTGTRKTTGK